MPPSDNQGFMAITSNRLPENFPYLLMISIGSFSFFYAGTNTQEIYPYTLYATPILSSITILTLLLITAKKNTLKDSTSDELKLSRALSLAFALVSILATNILKSSMSFKYAGYFMSIFQLLIFIIYCGLREKFEETSGHEQYSQIRITTSLYLLISSISFSISDSDSIVSKDDEVNHLFFCGLFFGIMWSITMIFWCYKIKRSVSIQVK